MNHFISEFKAFAMRGNVIDMAVGVVIGAAFGKIVDSLVNHIMLPLIGAVSGGIDFSNLKYSFVSQLTDKKVDLPYGLFIQSIVSFTIIAFSIFLVVKLMNRLKVQQEQPSAPQAPAEPPVEVKLLTEIRDLLKK